LLPPPLNSQASPSPTSAIYKHPFQHRDEYQSNRTPHNQSIYSERRDHEFQDNRHADYQRPSDSMHNHHPIYSVKMPAPGQLLPPPAHSNTGNSTLRRDDFASPLSRNLYHSEIGHITQNKAHHRTQESPHDMPYGYVVAQESRFASLNERENGNAWQEKQYRPPPHPVPVESTSYNTGMRYQG
jgi:hypothetical protein